MEEIDRDREREKKRNDPSAEEKSEFFSSKTPPFELVVHCANTITTIDRTCEIPSNL